MKLYWRSLDELENTPEYEQFLHREFPQAASEYPTDVSRRRWMQLMGASVALASVAGCRWEDEIITTYNERPEDRVPGIPQKYASFEERCGYSLGTLVTSFDGRPIKVDVNAEHPQGYKGTHSFAQASVLNLYDPDRISRDPATNKQLRNYDPKHEVGALRLRSKDSAAARTWGDFEAELESLLKDAGDGSKLRVLSEVSSSLTRSRLKSELAKKFSKLTWVEYEPVSNGNEIAGLNTAFGQPVRQTYDLAKADVVVCLDSDLLGTHPGGLKNAADWAERRVPSSGKMNRVYSVESQYTTTGSIADHRLPLASSRIPAFLAELIQEVKNYSEKSDRTAPKESDKATKILHAMASDLAASKGHAVVSVGSQHSEDVHVAVAHLNQMLESFGKTIQLVEEPLSAETGPKGLESLVKEMQTGKVDTLVILGGNPVYNSPVDIDFGVALESVKTSIHLSEYDDETSLKCNWHLPRAAALESWGDGRSYNGTITVRQPLINPFHQGKTEEELLALVLGLEENSADSLVRSTIADLLGDGGKISDRVWRKIVHDGFTKKSPLKSVEAKVSGNAPKLPENTASEDDIELVFYPSETSYDGRFANNGWMQETPDYLTKLTWDNVAIFSFSMAEKLGVEHGTLTTLKLQGKEITVPAYILPGQAYGSIGLALGYGRTAAGHVGGSVLDEIDPVGANAYELMTSFAPGFSTGLEVVPSSTEYTLAITQDHFSIDQNGMKEIDHRRTELIREATLKEYTGNPDFVDSRAHNVDTEPLFDHPEKFDKGYQWGMSMDLAKCIGCNACTVACQSENNVPIVGKEQVIAGREMHWIRIDRYFAGDPEHPDDTAIAVQPVTCQHCENAPCEQVCPVAATVHSEEGLNDMAYNRCIGTRYCGNNCPYKVRRFNYFYFNKPLHEPGGDLVQLTLNPEVTVRTRGVMEKCSFCVQRIQNGKITAMNEQRTVRDGEIVTACQDACPTNAIEFGNILDENSKVAKAHADSRAYGLLDAELDTRPRNKYLGRVRNPHPSLEAEYYLQPGGHGPGDDHGAGHGDGHDAHHDDEHKHDDHKGDHKKDDHDSHKGESKDTDKKEADKKETDKKKEPVEST